MKKKNEDVTNKSQNSKLPIVIVEQKTSVDKCSQKHYFWIKIKLGQEGLNKSMKKKNEKKNTDKKENNKKKMNWW